jgi:hypothetical protein
MLPGRPGLSRSLTQDETQEGQTNFHDPVRVTKLDLGSRRKNSLIRRTFHRQSSGLLKLQLFGALARSFV